MGLFDKRERSFEDKFAHDETLKFKALARRNKLLAGWAGALLGLGADQIETYREALIRADLEEAGDEDVFRKLRADFDAKGIKVSDHQIRREMEERLAQAVKEVEEGK
jgi:hypothetical protein